MISRRFSSTHRLWRRLFLLGITTVLFSIVLPLWTLWYWGRPTNEQPPRQIRISRGISAQQIGHLLERENLVHSAAVFSWIVRLKGLGQQLEAGTYWLDGSRNTEELIEDLLKAPIQTRRITIPEGLTRHDIAGQLQASGLIDSTLFIADTENPELIRQFGIEASTLEGYLFPETYFFDIETDESRIITAMVEEFHRVFTDSLSTRLKELDFSLHQAITLASIVEREAAIAEERPIISGVFHRRLKLNRRLESCATVEYALGVHKKRLTNADLHVKSPFNTYRHRGLPPGPIGNPGQSSILATLYPSDTEYLYFVARGDGTHIFSRSNKEHERAKKKIKRQERLARKTRNR